MRKESIYIFLKVFNYSLIPKGWPIRIAIEKGELFLFHPHILCIPGQQALFLLLSLPVSEWRAGGLTILEREKQMSQ